MAPGFPLQKGRKIEPKKSEAWLFKADGGGWVLALLSLLLSINMHLLSDCCMLASVRSPSRAYILGGRDGH